MESRKVLLLDGNSIMNRAFYGIRELTTSDGKHTNAVYGFVNILQKLIREENPAEVKAAFDMRMKTFRHSMYEGYKAGRKSMPEELAEQIPYAKEILTAMAIRIYECEGYEADDIIGTLSKRCEAAQQDCVIVTGDRDALQLIGERVRVKLVISRAGRSTTEDFGIAEFEDKYGFAPHNMIDYKALMGDSSDNIPGVAGIGEKTAGDLIKLFTNIDGVYANIADTRIKGGVRKKLEAGREMARLSYDLARIDRAVPLSEDDTTETRDVDKAALLEIYKRLEFTKLIERSGLAEDDTEAVEIEWRSAGVEEVLEWCRSCEGLSVAADRELSVIAILNGTVGYSLTENAIGESDYAGFVRELYGKGIGKRVENVKELLRELGKRGIQGENFIFDTALAAYILNPKETGDKKAGRVEDERINLLNEESGIESVIREKVKAVESKWKRLGVQLEKQGAEELYYKIELPLCSVLANMEADGIEVDRSGLKAFGQRLGRQIQELEEAIFAEAGGEFNINSTKQLAELLFERLRLPTGAKTKSGYSTSIEVLEGLRGKHEIIEKLIEYRQLTKLKSTYADGLLKNISAAGRIHTTFNMMSTATGRLSSTEPNLQNIPVRTELGGEIRRLFVAGEGKKLIGADYSQIELRILAHISGDSNMIAAFECGEDIHRATASQVFETAIEAVTAEQRSRAKAVNFGIVYGISDYSLAQDIGVTRMQARQYIDAYLGKYSGIREYMQEVVERARREGYAETLYGRRRYLPELASKNHNTRSFGERVAMNMPIQGTAADIIKIAMVNISRRIEREGLKVRLLLQVHDELIAESEEAHAEAAAKIIKEEMEAAAYLRTALVAEAYIGCNWYETKK